MQTMSADAKQAVETELEPALHEPQQALEVTRR